MTYWAIVCENYKGNDVTYYFENYKIAKKNFDILCEKYQNKDEFILENNHCEWFDACYNEYSTFICLCQTTIHIFDEIIF